ncbi:MAG TPA: 2-C-methyl-D-erythritol 4-phosphate cytidylyltransferase [Candidatus Polarisedimenticolia bacterium]|nr:2-C-methyl-D-erythritol 4-phosphate cytidylyltransferase [Candidatus Polarisedimenticolia bacterium]
MGTTAIIVAAGSGLRMGGPLPKAFAELAGVPMVEHSLRLFQDHPEVQSIVLMVPAGSLAPASDLARAYGKVVAVAEGGRRRQDTVRSALGHARRAAGGGGGGLVLVHDAARPLATPALVSAVLAAAARHGAAVPGVAPADTVREVAEGPAGRLIGAATLDRRRVVLVQTPQAFALDLLEEAHAAADSEATDDGALVERLGRPVEVVPGEPGNFKITTPEDLARARAVLAGR